MTIKKAVIAELESYISDTPPESGGILGFKDKNDVISEIAFDLSPETYSCCYRPNVEYLNQLISEWETNSIEFAGMFHTHFFGIKTLSEADIIYIELIMNAMPPEINRLYFPVYVLPDRKLIAYIADRKNEPLIIREDTVDVIK